MIGPVTLILSQRDIRELLPMDACMDVVADSLRTLARGEAQNPLRWGMRLDDGRGLIGMMPGALGSPTALGLKIVTVFPGNHGTPLDSHQGVVVLFDPANGSTTAILDASEITAIRTGAASGVATRLLAREDAGDLAILGSGVQAASHLAAMAVARTLRRVRVFSPNRDRLEKFSRLATGRHGIPVEPMDTAESTVRGADLICTTTSAKTPVLEGAWIASGAHINAAGSSVKSTRELDTAAVVGSRLFIDRRESTVNEAGDYLIPLQEGVLTEEHIVAEIGDLLLGRAEGRGSSDEITLFKSLGLAIWDLAAATHVVQAARDRGMGTEVEMGGVKYGADEDGPDPAP